MNVYNQLIDLNLEKNMGIFNMTDDFFGLLLNKVFISKDNNVLVVVDSVYEANTLFRSLSCYNDNVSLFLMDDFLTSEALALSPEFKVMRLETLNKICFSEKSIVITNLMGYLRFLPKKDDYLDSIININIGSIISPKNLVSQLQQLGYSKSTLVSKTGDYAVRGFVVDVFPISEDNPIRIEFFDDEIESIRYFDSDTQKSIKNVNSLTINPCSEFLLPLSIKLENRDYKQKELPLLNETVNITGYLDNCITFFKDYNQLLSSYNSYINEANTYREEKDITFEGDYFYKLESLKPSFPVYYYSLNNISNDFYIDSTMDYKVKTINNFNEDKEVINNYLKKNIKDGKTIIICLKKYQIKSIIKHLDVKIIETSMKSIVLNQVNIIEQDFSKGFIYNDFIFLTANELFKNKDNTKKRTTKFKYSTTIKDINKINIGDYVVHNAHGIGVYKGIKTLTVNDIKKDYVEVAYLGTDKIYIPVEKIDLLSKYSGREGSTPKINKLGGLEWAKTKARVKQKVVDMADKLLKIYAEREKSIGFSFSKDCELSYEFEKDFPYRLTTDQERAITQIKNDMESPIPMDRLLCGDVGFGKTEVAFVAAFKAILDSKQVLFLCPTTILSKQHYDNALIRFKNYPINIALLNRFTPSKEVNKIIDGLKNGTIDLVFGTHRLLSSDVVLKNLGLLIIDEEQRFGVLHKEKIKEYKSNVDVLTLTATPIPRTLQMSLVGIRSLSLIETPPVDRYPIQTYLVEENKQIIKEAIKKELAREGQVFILYNRVQTIKEYANRIQDIVPEARICIAHGQMSKNDLEKAVYDFVNYQYDILLCTTIIETGIDIPNVNTLIVIDADRFGLSQLYQIRGRVGRSDRFAYAYLMYQPFKNLTSNAIKRLEAIKEFTELGSGFSIATRDLSIRGAGDILGSEQAGYIDSVGIDLYLKMLNEEVNGENITDEEESRKPILNVSTHIADNYVQEEEIKIEIHKMICTIDSMDKYNKVKAELEDRFGKLSEDIIIYMYEEWLENLVSKIGIKRLNQTKNSIELVFSEDLVSKIDTEELFYDAFKISNMFRFISRGSNMIIILDIIKLDKHPVYYLVELLNNILEKHLNTID